jgi:hypothetical protein
MASVLGKTADGVTSAQQSSTSVMQTLAQLQVERQAAENAKAKQRSEALRIDTAKAIVAQKEDYPEEVVERAKTFLLTMFD